MLSTYQKHWDLKYSYRLHLQTDITVDISQITIFVFQIVESLWEL